MFDAADVSENIKISGGYCIASIKECNVGCSFLFKQITLKLFKALSLKYSSRTGYRIYNKPVYVESVQIGLKIIIQLFYFNFKYFD